MLKRVFDLPLSVGSTAVYPYSEALYRHFIVPTRFGDPVALATQDGPYLHVPRQLAPLGGLDRRSWGHPSALKCSTPPRSEEQARVIRASLQLLRKGQNHVMQMATGGGKTYAALNIAAQLGVTTLVVVTKDTLKRQWIREAARFYDIPESKVGEIQQDVCNVEGKSIVIGMLHSLCKDKYPEWIKDYPGFVVFDEVQRVPADTFMTVASMFSAVYRLGLSATPKRPDGRDFILEAHIGPILVKSELPLLSPKVLVVKTDFEWPLVVDREGAIIVKRKPILTPGKLGRLYGYLAQDPVRNKIICSFLIQAYHKKRRSVAFSQLDGKHLGVLQDMLIDAGIPPDDIGRFSGTTKNKKVLEQQKYKPIVLATYAMCKEGVDVPQWDTVVFGLPLADIEQALGRVLREYEGKAPPVCLDLVDARIPVLWNYYRKRHRYYKKITAEIKEK